MLISIISGKFHKPLPRRGDKDNASYLFVQNLNVLLLTAVLYFVGQKQRLSMCWRSYVGV